MSDYTPDEVELRDCYAHHLSEYAGEDYAEAQKDAERGIERIRADALRGAGNIEKLLDEALDANRTFRDANAVLRKKACEAESRVERLEALAGALYREHGVRVTEGDESNE